MSMLTALHRLRPGTIHRPRTRTLNSPPVDIRTLPDPTITPGERAWATYRYLKAHPAEWEQKTYGEFLPDGSTVGCFAHHLVKQAGYTEFGCDHKRNGKSCQPQCDRCRQAGTVRRCVDASNVKTESGWEPVSEVADRLLHTGRVYNLYSGGNSLADIEEVLTLLFGPERDCRA